MRSKETFGKPKVKENQNLKEKKEDTRSEKEIRRSFMEATHITVRDGDRNIISRISYACNLDLFFTLCLRQLHNWYSGRRRDVVSRLRNVDITKLT